MIWKRTDIATDQPVVYPGHAGDLGERENDNLLSTSAPHMVRNGFLLDRLFFMGPKLPGALFMALGLTLAFLVFPGCEKVIDVDLSESDPALVIEGNLSYSEGELAVKISKTGSYFDAVNPEQVAGAEVYLEGGPGFRLQAEETGDGSYQLKDLPLNFGTNYRLSVKAEGEEYTAVSTLNPQVKIDSLGYDYQPKERFFDGGYRILLYFSDPPTTENYYRVKVYKNSQLFNSADDIIVFDDSSLDGKGIQVRLRGQVFEEGDTARVELYAIDENAWEYFSTLRELVNQNPGSPSPANPVSNFSNGALGYFSAWSRDAREVTIPEK